MSNGFGRKPTSLRVPKRSKKIGGIEPTHDHDRHLWNHHTEAIEQILSHNAWNRNVKENGAESGGICRDFRDSLWSGDRSIDFIAGLAEGMTDQREDRRLVVHHQNRTAFAGRHATSLGGARTGGQLLRRYPSSRTTSMLRRTRRFLSGKPLRGTGATEASGPRHRPATDRRVTPASRVPRRSAPRSRDGTLPK